MDRLLWGSRVDDPMNDGGGNDGIEQRSEELLPQRRGRLALAFDGTLYCPSLVRERDDGGFEVAAIVRPSLARLGEAQAESNVGIGALDSLGQHHRVELPFPGFRAVGAAGIVPGVMNPQLSNGA